MNNTAPQTPDLQVIHRVRIEVTWKSIFRCFLAVMLAYLAILLWPIVKLLILSVLIAVALYPTVVWVDRMGCPRWAGQFLAAFALPVLFVGCFIVIGPLLFHQFAALGDNLPRLRDQFIAQLPPSGPLHLALENSINPGTVADSRLLLQKAMVLTETTVGGLIYVIVVITLAVYLILDGANAMRWLIRFCPVTERAKILEALSQISRLVSSYVSGQCLISVFCAAYMFLIATLLGVPTALLLAIVAGICDIVPIIGFFVAVFLAMALAFSISPTTSLLILVLYGAYHLFENLFIVPKVYGRQLKLSKVAVPIAIAAGGMVAGVVGAVAVLPLVAAYPVVERLWLAPKLPPETVSANNEKTV
jgi:predicted PurR-regulated permease PerM